ncbi:MAG: CHAT domain-containing protein [Saprospiraceae bacterium]
MMRSAIFLLFIFFSNQVVAQNDSLQAEYMVQLAKTCLKEGKLDSSNYYIDKARRIFKEKNLLTPWLKSYPPLAYVVAGELKQPFKAVELIETGLHEKWREPANKNEWEQYAMTLNAAGHVLRSKAGDFIGAKAYYEQAQQIFIQKLAEQSDRVAKYLYHNLANIYTRLGDYDRAITLLRRSLRYNELYPNAKVIDHGDLAIALGEIGQYEEALLIVRQGLSIPELSSEIKITLYQNEADALSKLGKNAEAMRSLEKIPELIPKMVAEKGSLDENYYLMQYYASKAEIQILQGQKHLAEPNFLKAIQAGKKNWGTERRREIGKVYGELGTLKLEQKQPREALAYFHHALYCVLPGLDLKEVSKSPSSNTFYSENTILEALQGKARAFQALNQLDRALECYELIPFVEAKIRATHAYESSSLLALQESRQRFNEAIDIAWQLFEQSIGNPKYAERAFRLSEMARGMLLLQNLVQARQYLPDDIREKDFALRVRMAWLEHEIAEGAEDEKKAWQNQLFDLKLERQNLLANFPAYNNSDSVYLQVQAAENVQKLLRPGQAMVNIFLTETDAYIFSFDANGDFRWRKTLLPALFRTQTQQFANYLKTGEDAGREQFLSHAWLLDSMLLGPECARWGAKTNSIIIVPDDVLMLVPFEVLLSKAPDYSLRSTWRDQPWLLKDYNIGYAYSATLLGVQKGICDEHTKAKSRPPKTFGGFAPSYSQSGTYKIENTRPLVKKVCNLLGGDAWLGSKSSEERFKKSAASYQTLLLAMHGISDNEYPERSRLLFGDSGHDSLINNNVLYTSELQIMRLKADLVVLSACHSGSGKLEQGEGVYSLARAFAAAGVPATVMSLWLLHENTAPPLVEAFFKYMQAGKTKDEALRLSKLEFLQKDENFEMTHPFFWAGLAASGDMRALELPSEPAFKLYWWWLIIATVFLGAAGIWWWTRRNVAFKTTVS